MHLLEEFEKLNTGGNPVLSRVLEIAPPKALGISKRFSGLIAMVLKKSCDSMYFEFINM